MGIQVIALLDGDILVYESGFSSDANAKKDALERGEELAGTEHEPLAFCLKIVKNKIDELVTISKADSYKIYLTGKNNFRNKILPEYKANRDPANRPHWYKEIQEYLVEVHSATIVNGMEADDAMGIEQCNSDDWTCICSKDKDMDGVPGWHYNWSPTKYEKGLYFVDDVEALRFFYTQCLTGDSTDNIPGIFKSIGKKCSKKMKEMVASCNTEKEMYDYVVDQYDGFDFTPIAQCLWILRKEEAIWVTPE
jgi:5'-3' exonuclease